MNEQEYWNKFYSDNVSEKKLTVPSQFAAFVLGETHAIDSIVEFGCGNGRDSAFFARHGKTVFALDLSSDGIAINQETYAHVSNLKFHACDVTADIPDIGLNHNEPKAIYARFFIHALQTEDVAKFFANCSKLMSPQDLFFIEYRTEDDAERTKATSAHYRNFLNAAKVEAMLNANGLKTSYLVQGLGFAKWKVDDAFVARHIIGTIKNGY
jgi:cyclopropane fatty-acyl-phospholipid synthase-like methyltransferase